MPSLKELSVVHKDEPMACRVCGKELLLTAAGPSHGQFVGCVCAGSATIPIPEGALLVGPIGGPYWIYETRWSAV
jgi:hypothetical protein